jgi:hypothetical protein
MNLRCPVVRGGLALSPALCALAFLSACGGSSPAAISASAASTLHRDVQRIRSAAADHHAHGARAAVDGLRSDIGRFVARGELSRSDARVLMVEAGQVDGRVSVEVKAVSTPSTTQSSAVTTSTPTTTQPTPATPSVPSDGNGHGNGKRKGHGHGNKHGGD